MVIVGKSLIVNLSVSDCSEINVISYTKKTENVENTVSLIVIGVAASPQQ